MEIPHERQSEVPFRRSPRGRSGRRAAAEFAHDEPATQAPALSPLAAHSLLWQVIREKLLGAMRWLGLARA